jgi:hypothetical protein
MGGACSMFPAVFAVTFRQYLPFLSVSICCYFPAVFAVTFQQYLLLLSRLQVSKKDGEVRESRACLRKDFLQQVFFFKDLVRDNQFPKTLVLHTNHG